MKTKDFLAHLPQHAHAFGTFVPKKEKTGSQSS
jgi:hypothetical protein